MDLIDGDLIWHTRLVEDVPLYDLVKLGTIEHVEVGRGKQRVYMAYAVMVELDARDPGTFQVGAVHPVVLHDHYWYMDKPDGVRHTIKDRSPREMTMNLCASTFDMENQLHGTFYDDNGEYCGSTFYRGDCIVYLSKDQKRCEGLCMIKVKVYPMDHPIRDIVCDAHDRHSL